MQRRVFLAVGIGLLGAALVSVAGLSAYFTFRHSISGRNVQVPDLTELTLEEAAAFVTKAKEDHAASLSEAEQKLLKSEEARTEAKRLRDESYDIIRKNLAADALEDLGMPRQSARHYAGMVQPSFTQGMNDDARVAAIVAAAQQLKDTYPDLFVAPGGNGRPGPTDTATRGGRPPTSQGGETSKDRAMARLRERRGGRLSSDVVPAQTEIDATRR